MGMLEECFLTQCALRLNYLVVIQQLSDPLQLWVLPGMDSDPENLLEIREAIEVMLHLERLCCFVIPQVRNYDPKMGAQHTFLKIQYLDHSLTFHRNEQVILSVNS